VIIVAHSMGAAITRGFLHVSVEQNHTVATAMTDSVFFIAGANDGSYLPRVALNLQNFPVVGRFVIRDLVNGLAANLGFDPNRPAVNQLAGASEWYKWANGAEGLGAAEEGLPDIGYYNAYGDIRLGAGVVCARFNLYGKRCFDTPTIELGDGALLRGTTDPFDTPERGGAQFSRPNTAEQWQWDYGRTVPLNLVDFSDEEQSKEAIDFLKGRIAGLAELHTNIPGTDGLGQNSLETVTVQDCSVADGDFISLKSQLAAIIDAKRGFGDYACIRH
jgi:hypothetical protein